jgi:MFS family permease
LEEIMATDIKAREKTPGYAWVILAIVFLASFSVPVTFFKIPTIAPVLMESFGFTPDTFGWMMSMFTFISIVLSFPAAGLAKKFGYRTVSIVALCCSIVGGLIGVFAPNAGVLLFSRFLEGLGMGFFGVIAPAMLAQWFPRSTFGVAAGIWAIWMPAGGTLMSLLVPSLYNSTGAWQSAWWFGIIYCAVVLVLFIVLYRNPPKAAEPVEQEGVEKKSSKGGLLKTFSLSMIMVGVMFTIFNLANNGTVNTYLAPFLQMDKGIDMQTAGLIASVTLFGGLISNVLGGFISDRLGTRKWAIVVGLAALLVGTWFAFDFASDTTMWIGVILIGFIPGVVSAATTAAIPEIIPNKEDQGYGMAMLGFGSGIGSFIGGLALGWLQPVLGYAMGAHVLLVPLILIAIGCTLFIKVR